MAINRPLIRCRTLEASSRCGQRCWVLPLKLWIGESAGRTALICTTRSGFPSSTTQTASPGHRGKTRSGSNAIPVTSGRLTGFRRRIRMRTWALGRKLSPCTLSPRRTAAFQILPLVPARPPRSALNRPILGRRSPQRRSAPSNAHLGRSPVLERLPRSLFDLVSKKLRTAGARLIDERPFRATERDRDTCSNFGPRRGR
jgi:hypothetical protein